MPDNPETEKLWTTAELAAALRCSAKFIRDEIRRGKIRAIRIGHGNPVGSRLRIRHSEAERYIKSLNVP